MIAYLITLSGCDAVVACGETPWAAVERVISIFNLEEGCEFDHTALESLQELGEYVDGRSER